MRPFVHGGTASMKPKISVARSLFALLFVAALGRGTTFAQVTPASGYTPPDDTPAIKVGMTIFTDYTYTDEPTATDADGNVINPSAFNVSRAYINVTGSISHRVSFRITPDITRLTTTTKSTLGTGESVSASNSLDGSLTYRLKAAFGQFHLDEASSKGTWAPLGEQQTPYGDCDD